MIALHTDSLMAQLVVRNLEEDLIIKLKKRAAENGRSAEAEHRDILRQALAEEPRRSFRELAAMLPRLPTRADSPICKCLQI